MNLQSLPGHTSCSSWNDFLPVFRSGQDSYGDNSVEPVETGVLSSSFWVLLDDFDSFLFRFFDCGGASLAACITRGFSNATFIRSIC